MTNNREIYVWVGSVKRLSVIYIIAIEMDIVREEARGDTRCRHGEYVL